MSDTLAALIERERISERRMREAFERALQEIARGRVDCGLPLAREKAREIARAALVRHDRKW